MSETAVAVRHSETIAELADALSKAQGEMDGAKKDAVNPHFRSKYADLESVWDACREPLSKHGLSVLQPVSGSGKQVCVTTMLTHKSGQWIASDLYLTAVQDNPQAVGSAITYGRRYGLSSMVGIAPEDDDGNAGSGAGSKQAAAEVAAQKLQGAPAETKARYEKPAPRIDDSDIPRELGGTSPSGPPPRDRVAEARDRIKTMPSPAPPNDEPLEVIPPQVVGLWGRMKDKFSSLEVFGEMKDLLQLKLGDDDGIARYKQVLREVCGVEKSDAIDYRKHMANARRSVLVMWNDAHN